MISSMGMTILVSARHDDSARRSERSLRSTEASAFPSLSPL